MNSEASRYIALSPENGTQFTQGQKIEFNVKPSIGFIKGRSSYISLNLERDSDNARMAHPYNTVGANGWIDRVDIYSLNSGQLLESLTNYNIMANLENQYLHEGADDLVIKQGCLEPLRSHIVSVDSNTKVVTSIAETALVQQNGATVLSSISNDGFDKGFSRKFCIPIRSGIFNHYGEDEKLTPNVLLGGLRIEITCAKNEHALSAVSSQDDTGAKHRMNDYANGVPVNNIGAANVAITTADVRSAQNLGLSVGNQILISNAESSVVETRNITAIAHNANKMEVTFDGAALSIGGGGGAGTAVRISHPPNQKLKYIVRDLELKVLEVIPPANMMKNVIKESQVDFISYESFLDNLPASSLTHQTRFPSVATRAKCIMTHYVDDRFANDEYAPTHYIGGNPTETKLNSVQYFINNKLYPLRAYNPDCKEDRIVAYNEIVKAFASIGKTVKRLGDSRGGGQSDYNFTYVTARELARGKDFVYQLKDAEAELRTEYSAVRTANHRLISFVFSVRSIMIDDGSVSLML